MVFRNSLSGLGKYQLYMLINSGAYSAPIGTVGIATAFVDATTMSHYMSLSSIVAVEMILIALLICSTVQN